MEGNIFWNMVAMSLICMPSEPKLFRMRSGWWLNCCLCIRCFFSVETTSLEREYWGEVERKCHQAVVWDTSQPCACLMWNIYLEHPEIKRGAFGESGKPLETQKHCYGMVFQRFKDITIVFCLPASDPTMLMVLWVLLKIIKWVTPRGPAIVTKSFSTFFFLIWQKKGNTERLMSMMERWISFMCVHDTSRQPCNKSSHCGRLISAFTLKTNHWAIKSEFIIIWAESVWMTDQKPRVVEDHGDTLLHQHHSYLQTNLQRLGGIRHHDVPHVLDELTHVFPNLTSIEDERVRYRTKRLLGHMVGCGAGFLLVLTLKSRSTGRLTQKGRNDMGSPKRGQQRSN